MISGIAFKSEARDKYKTADGSPANHDRAMAEEIILRDGVAVLVAAVADGCGGDDRGTRVAQLAIDRLRAAVTAADAETLSHDDPAAEWAESWGRRLQDEVVQGPLKGGNSTLSACILTPDGKEIGAWRLLALNVGDSRARLFVGRALELRGVAPPPPPDNPNTAENGKSLVRAVGLNARAGYPFFDTKVTIIPASALPAIVAVSSDGVDSFSSVVQVGGKKAMRENVLLSPREFKKIIADGYLDFASLPQALLDRSLATADANGFSHLDNSTVAMAGVGLEPGAVSLPADLNEPLPPPRVYPKDSPPVEEKAPPVKTASEKTSPTAKANRPARKRKGSLAAVLFALFAIIAVVIVVMVQASSRKRSSNPRVLPPDNTMASAANGAAVSFTPSAMPGPRSPQGSSSPAEVSTNGIASAGPSATNAVAAIPSPAVTNAPSAGGASATNDVSSATAAASTNVAAVVEAKPVPSFPTNAVMELVGNPEFGMYCGMLADSAANMSKDEHGKVEKSLRRIVSQWLERKYPDVAIDHLRICPGCDDCHDLTVARSKSRYQDERRAVFEAFVRLAWEKVAPLVSEGRSNPKEVDAGLKKIWQALVEK